MKLIFQNDKRLNKNIRLSGCRFRCLLAIAEYESGVPLTAEQIESIYDKAIQVPTVMKPDCTCGSLEHRIINQGYSVLGNKRNGAQVGSNDIGGTPEYWSGNTHNWIIHRWKTTTGYHFTLSSSDNSIKWDPWSLNFDGPLNIVNEIEHLLYNTWSTGR